MKRTALQRGLLIPRAFQAASSQRITALRQGARFASAVPIIVRPSFWKSLVPKPLRRSGGAIESKKTKSREPNPATFFIIIFLFIGSMAIQMITLKKETETFMRQSDTRIGLLREVIEKVQRGEEVDVERVLGTGDPEKELEWEEVLREIERDDAVRNPKKKQTESTPSASPKPAVASSTQAVQATQPIAASSRPFFF